MNLKQLFETQNVLRERIGYNGSDRLNKLVLALLVEIGECANELPEVFKFWSTKKQNNYKKALVEYVDGVHFVLELGLELGVKNTVYLHQEIKSETHPDMATQFILINNAATKLLLDINLEQYEILVRKYLGLGEMIGFSWEQIQAAYFSKNYINHQRQDAGY
ncbi:Uncharacterized protein conserved in bacteria [Acinetobacter baumannii]|nr:Uncharacterized protein conserved in bacteria [Acinetobacter baumannii]